MSSPPKVNKDRSNSGEGPVGINSNLNQNEKNEKVSIPVKTLEETTIDQVEVVEVLRQEQVQALRPDLVALKEPGQDQVQRTDIGPDPVPVLEPRQVQKPDQIRVAEDPMPNQEEQILSQMVIRTQVTRKNPNALSQARPTPLSLANSIANLNLNGSDLRSAVYMKVLDGIAEERQIELTKLRLFQSSFEQKKG